MRCSSCSVLMGDKHAFCYACGAPNKSSKPSKFSKPRKSNHTKRSAQVIVEVDTKETIQGNALYDEARIFVIESGRTTITSLIRRFRIDDDMALEILYELEKEGVIARKCSQGVRELLIETV